MGLFALLLANQSAKAQEVTITLLPGYTWISYPGTDTLDFATAMGSFTPVQGDIIQSQWGNAQYRNGRWQGSVSNFYPGYGYKYKSTRQVPVSVTFNAQQASSQVVVSTSEPMLITGNSAMGGGEVTTTDGTYIIVKGLCWATHENPTTNDDFYEEAESGVGTFSISMTELNIATTYYVRAYAVTLNGTVYGDQKTFTTRDGIPEVSTASVTDIMNTHATSGGTVTDDGGLTVIARGVCWSTLHNPTISDSHTTNGAGVGSFTSSITGLALGTTYYVRAYATTSQVTVYGEEMSLTTPNDYAYVDLGLPSGLLWATCNVGADTPEDYGDYFAWGETQPKSTYNWNTYQYCMGSGNTLTKYCNNASYGYNGFTDNLTVLEASDDAATVQWGSGWRMPTLAEWQELLDNTTHIWTTQNGVNGRLLTATNGNSLFLPAAGDSYESSLNDAGSRGYYRSSLLNTVYPFNAMGLDINSSNCNMGGYYGRTNGQSVRPVRSSRQN